MINKADASLVTARLYMRPLREEDVTQTYVDWLNNPEVNRYLETRHSVQTLDTCREFVRRCNADDLEHLFGVFLKDSGRHVGNAKLGFINQLHRRGQISLVIGEKSFWGLGLAREIVHALTRHGFGRLELDRLEAGCYEENLSSLRVFLSVGYTVEGFFRSHALNVGGQRTGCFWMGMLRHEFDCGRE